MRTFQMLAGVALALANLSAGAVEAPEGAVITVDTATDPRLARDLGTVFQRYPGAFPASLRGAVTDGWVTLSGRVDTLHQKLAAETLVRQVPGVNGVDNRVEVTPVEATDRQLAATVRRRLRRSPVLDHQAIAVQVQHGVVLLDGTVATDFDRLHARDVVERTAGVQGVQERLSLRPGTPPPPDDVLAQRVRHALAWSPWVDADRISVAVHDGVVTVSGTVGSHVAWLAAGDNARKAGARAVVNQITIQERAPRPSTR